MPNDPYHSHDPLHDWVREQNKFCVPFWFSAADIRSFFETFATCNRCWNLTISNKLKFSRSWLAWGRGVQKHLT